MKTKIAFAIVCEIIRFTNHPGRARHSVRAAAGQSTRSAGRGLPALPISTRLFVIWTIPIVCTLLALAAPHATAGGITLTDFKLTGNLGGDAAAFTLTANAKVDDPRGGSLELLSGPVALTSLDPRQKWTMDAGQNRFIARFDRSGNYPIEVHFNAAVATSNDWRAVNFRVAPGIVQPVVLQGLAADTEFLFASAARPERAGTNFISYLPVDGSVSFAWRAARPEAEGKLFYAAEMTSQISVSPGLMRQAALLNGKIMQGEMSKLVLKLHGAGEVTRVQGDAVLAWNVEPVKNSDDRQLVIQFNQPQKDSFAVLVQMQTPLGAFPQSADAVHLQPEGATQFSGSFRVVNDGAVRLEVTQASGLSQISPDQFPEGRIAMSFSGPGLTIQRAVYAATDGAGECDVTAKLSELARDGQIVLNVGNDALGRDPAPYHNKELRVDYTLYGIPGHAVAKESETLTLPATTGATANIIRATGSQRFAYRFSSADFALRINADQILPEVGVSQVLAYNLGENELAVDADIELDIREAPLREVLLNIPKGYAIARLNASGMSDYFTGENTAHDGLELRIVYGQPVSDRQVIQLRLEHNQSLGETSWTLPRIEVAKAKSVRGFVGVSADSGFRLTPESTQALTEIATAFFPSQLAGIQSAFRLSDADWSATMRVERLPQTVQADVFHLFSIGEGIAYGSSVMNYVISGAPVSAFRIELSDEYANVEFTGKDIRNWQKTANGWLVQLHSPVSGAYTLLATYERPFKSQGETLTFTGARPADAQSESGYTIITSAYQFDVKSADVSPGLLELESGEVPPEYRLFFDQPVLKAFRYPARPFNLKLALSPLAQGDSLAQVTDRASLVTHISKEGQAITDARYFVKSRGNPDFRVSLPDGAQLWSATVNGATVVPVVDQKSILIPLPQHADPDTVLTLDLKVAATSSVPARVSIAAPIVAAPVMLAEWKIEPDEGQRLIYRSGTLTPAVRAADNSGFAQIEQTLRSDAVDALTTLAMAVVLLVLAIALWRWAVGEGVQKFSPRHLLGSLAGLVAIFFAGILLLRLAGSFDSIASNAPNDVTFLAPVQQPASALVAEVANVPATAGTFAYGGSLMLAAFAVVFWVAGWIREEKFLPRILGWIFLAWAALRLPNGAPAFIAVIAAFLLIHAAIPALRQLWRVPSKPKTELPPQTDAPPVVAALLAGLLLLGGLTDSRAATTLPDSVIQQIRIENGAAIATAKIHWQAEKGETLPLLFDPAVLTKVNYPKSLNLESLPAGSRNAQQLVAKSRGAFDIEVQYQLQIPKGAADAGFVLPVPSGLVNRATLTLANLSVDVYSPQAVSVQRATSGSNTVATLTLAPGGAWVGWKPRSRDVKSEKAVFYAELSQLYIPSAGVVEGVHQVSIRPAQGQLGEIICDVPAGATVTDVADATDGKRQSIVSNWRFDPDARKLHITLNPAQSKPFALLIRSQVATGTLPFNQRVGLISVEDAANQIGLLGVATGNEVQLDDVGAEKFSAINLEDFPGDLTQPLAAQFPGLTVRRAFRYSDSTATALLKASAVEPDVRVETQDTLSLGEDRTVLASTANVTITRAGIFKLSFVMPPGFDVESISGAALSHWTELKTDAGRVITLNLTGKTDGQQQFIVSLSGPGLKTAHGWIVPQILFRQADKQRGTLLVVPEQGMRLEAAASDGVTQLDPQKSGVRQKGVLAFRILETPWKLALNVEQVDPWIQVTSLQHATVNEAQVKVTANLQYQIENAGLKEFRVLIPSNAEGVTFAGDQLSIFSRVDGAVTNGMQAWEIKLSRRVIGQYLLQANYQTPVAEKSGETAVRGVLAADVNLQRGFATVQSAGRLQLRVDDLPASLQPTEWQAIPHALQKDLSSATANFAYRIVEPDFQLPLKLERHDAAKLLPARVNDITFTSVISDAGVMLTQAHLDILPGDKRLLYLTLPKGADFWFAFVNQNGVWPWRDGDQILIPLEQSSRSDQPVPVEIYFSSQVGKAGGRALDLSLLAPKFDLPLENLTWRVFLNDKWQVKKWSGALQLQEQEVVANGGALDMAGYLQTEATAQRDKTRQAEQMLALGNSALQSGDPQQARRAFESAYGLSRNDAAFNEDARVQLNNLKLQQALVGLNVRQAKVATANNLYVNAGAANANLPGMANNGTLNYSQSDAKQIIDNNSADENSAFMKLADRLIKQQDAAVANPAVIRANIPEQGRLLTFKRAVVVDTWADLGINLVAHAANAVSWGMRLLVLGFTALLLAAVGLLARRFAKARQA